MTAQENIEQTKAAYAAFSAADIDAAGANLPDASAKIGGPSFREFLSS